VTAIAVALLVLLALPAHALAKKGVVVAEVSGPRAARVQRGVAAALGGSVRVIPSDRYQRSQRKLQARERTADNVARVARQIGADGVVFGEVKRQRGRFLVTVELRAGASGEVVESVEVALGGAPRLTKPQQRKLRDDLLPAIRALPPLRDRGGQAVAADAFDDDDYDAVPDDGVAGDRGDGAIDGSADRVARRDEADEDIFGAGGREPALDRDDGDVPTPGLDERLARDRGVDLAAGLSFTGRSFNFDLRDGIAGNQAPNGYSGAPVPGVFVSVALFPLAVASGGKHRGVLQNIGVTAVLDYVVAINSQFGEGAAGIDIPTTQYRWGVGAIYRHNFGDSVTSPSIDVNAGYNKLVFELDKAVAMDAGLNLSLPNFDYAYIDVGGGLRFPLARAGALFAGGHLLLVQDAGEIKKLYGAADVTAFDAAAGYEHRLTARVLVRGAARLQRVGFSFTGAGTESDRNGDGMSDVASATDLYYGGYLTAGYLF
jgi:hypothetical protein